MRLRHSLAAACGAFALTAVLVTPAHAATGDFTYKYTGLSGERLSGGLFDPVSGECVTLAQVAQPEVSEPAFAPHNGTDEYATVFTGPDCTGESWTLRPHGRPASDRLELRSVMFLER